jgi:hypothetical protein
MVAADGHQPVPSSREQASAKASRTRHSLPDVGEYVHTQFITAMLIAFSSQVSDSGSEMGAAISRQARSGVVAVRDHTSLTCADTAKQALRTLVRSVRDEVLIGPVASLHADTCW